MMRLERTTTLLAALYLLISAATAYAECAWVLWETITTKESQGSPEPVRAYTTKPDCDRALSDALAEFKNSPGRPARMDPQYQEAYVTMGKSTTAYGYRCLPDTVDPRGPKGK
jgi:hypothetical protein